MAWARFSAKNSQQVPGRPGARLQGAGARNQTIAGDLQRSGRRPEGSGRHSATIRNASRGVAARSEKIRRARWEARLHLAACRAASRGLGKALCNDRAEAKRKRDYVWQAAGPHPGRSEALCRDQDGIPRAREGDLQRSGMRHVISDTPLQGAGRDAGWRERRSSRQAWHGYRCFGRDGREQRRAGDFFWGPRIFVKAWRHGYRLVL